MHNVLKNGLYLAVTFIIILLTQGCSNDVTNISANDTQKSHNMGKNCMNCHNSGGSGDGIFKAAGTVYDSLRATTRPNGSVLLYTGKGGTGTLRAVLQVDGNGNFFTTASIDFTGGLYPTVKSVNGDTHNMPSSITGGECNNCHKDAETRIWVK